MSSALFGRSASGVGSTGGHKHLIEVKAGKMQFKGKMVHPDKRKGLVFLYRSDDSLVHFCWQDRTSGVIEDDLIIFPDDCEFVKVTNCPENARVYSLKFKSSKKLVFWMQEPKADKDEEICKKINQCMSNPSSVSTTNNLSSSGLTSNSHESDLQSLLNNMSHSQLMQLFNTQVGGLSGLINSINSPNSMSIPASLSHGSGSSSVPTTPSVTPASVQSSGMSTPKASSTSAANNEKSSSQSESGSNSNPAQIRLAELQNFLQNIQTDSQESKEPKVDLVSSFNLDLLNDFLKKKEVREHLKDYLPEIDNGMSTENQLKTTITCPQFQQALSQFSHALQSGQLGPVIEKMNISKEAVNAANRGSLHEFVQALEASESVKSDDKTPNDSKDKLE